MPAEHLTALGEQQWPRDRRDVSGPPAAAGLDGPDRSDAARPDPARTDARRTDAADPSASPAPRRSGVRYAVAWILTRAIMVTIWLVALVGYQVPSARGDVAYYYRAIAGLAARGPQVTMVEYPTPVLALTWLLYTLSGTREAVFLGLFVALMVGTDAAFSRFLWREAGPAGPVAVGFWIAFVFLLGPIVFLRFDLLPSVLTAAALLVATRRDPRTGLAGALVASAAALKLWPAATWPGTWGPDHRTRWRSFVGAVSVGGVLALLSAWWAGWARLISPLTWQSERGLQIESVFATLPMLARAFDPDRYVVAMSRYQAFEIAGPGTSGWLWVAGLASALGYLTVLGLAVVLWRRPTRGATAAVLVTVLAAVILVVANKTFSPQYMLWIGAPVAAGLARLTVSRAVSGDAASGDAAAIRRVAILVLALAATTAVVYPIGYRPLIYGLPGVGLVTAVLAIRNLGMLVLLAGLLHWAWRDVRQRRSA